MRQTDTDGTARVRRSGAGEEIMPNKLRALMVVAVLAVMAGACGSPEDGGPSGQKPDAANAGASAGTRAAAKPTAVETVRVAYRETAAEQTARTTFEMTTTGPLVGPGDGGRAAPMTMTITGEGVVDFSGAASSLTMGIAGMGDFEMRQVGDAAYVKMPEAFRTQVPGAKPWMRVDLDAVYEQQYGASPGQMQGGMARDPALQLEYLRGVSDSVEKVGTEKVRGAQTTHYRAVLDLAKEAAQQDPEVRGAHDDLVEQLGGDKLPVEVWLDDHERVRRFAIDVTMPVPKGTDAPGTPEGAEVRTQIKIDYYDFGLNVDVQAPPPDQTMDGSRLMSPQTPA